VAALTLKRQIDASNQVRTDMVEYLDSYFLDLYETVTPKNNATINSESPAWAFDRLSILALKIYHMNEEATRTDASDAHRLKSGDKYMKVYKQMKMYNDDELNPVLRAQK